MRIFITGASGRIASAVIPELHQAGHEVTGLARSDASAQAVEKLGAEVLRGDLADTDVLATAAQEHDGVIHLAFDHGLQRSGDLQGAVAADLAAVTAMGEAMKGTDKPFVGTNATGGLALAGFRGFLTEDDTLPGGPRVDAENTVIALAQDDVRSSVVRLPPAVHGSGTFGFVSGLAGVARASGFSGYVGDGANVWPSAATQDVAQLYRLALESATAGTRVHAVAEEGVPLVDIAGAIGKRLGVPVRPVAQEEADAHFGFLSMFVPLDNPVSSVITRGQLGWEPTQPGLIESIGGDPHLEPSAA